MICEGLADKEVDNLLRLSEDLWSSPKINNALSWIKTFRIKYEAKNFTEKKKKKKLTAGASRFGVCSSVV